MCLRKIISIKFFRTWGSGGWYENLRYYGYHLVWIVHNCMLCMYNTITFDYSFAWLSRCARGPLSSHGTKTSSLQTSRSSLSNLRGILCDESSCPLFQQTGPNATFEKENETRFVGKSCPQSGVKSGCVIDLKVLESGLKSSYSENNMLCMYFSLTIDLTIKRFSSARIK